VSEPRFGISTHVFHESSLTREHLVDVAGQGFEALELFATRTHFDYRNSTAIDELAGWLDDTRLALHAVHAPVAEAMRQGQWVGPFSNASGTESRRREAVEETRAALALARRIPFSYLVLHLGVVSAGATNDDNHPAAARRSLEEIVALASDVNVRVAVEVIPNRLSTPEALVHLIEEELDGVDVGICLDYGHAHLLGDLAEAIETVGGHLCTTHLHDNHGTRDEHLVPFAGGIDWSAAMMSTQKIGYDGVLMFELDGRSGPLAVLERADRARTRLDDLFITF
jgi:sugar phosphate isomerase/epimerase